jgi:hypothetical protein
MRGEASADDWRSLDERLNFALWDVEGDDGLKALGYVVQRLQERSVGPVGRKGRDLIYQVLQELADFLECTQREEDGGNGGTDDLGGR